MNTVNFVTIPASIVPDQEIVVSGDRRLTYAQLAEMVARYTAVFKHLGLGARTSSLRSTPTRIATSRATMPRRRPD